MQFPFKVRGPRTFPFLIVLFLVLAPSGVDAQEPQEDVIRVTTDLLLFPIRVKDKQGQFPNGLTERDLSLKDDDRVTAGLYLASGADRVALLFALDQSGSLRELIPQQRNAALGLFEKFGDRSSVAVLRFADKPQLTSGFSREAAKARAAFVFAGNSNRPTAIFDAGAAAVKSFESLPRSRAERRIVILISDGLDNASQTKPGTVIEDAKKDLVSFYVIHLPLFQPVDGRLTVRPPSKGFRDLAEKTGGKYFLVGDPKTALKRPAEIDLNPVFQAIEHDLKNQYLLGFYLNETAHDGRRHEFSLALPAGYEYQVPNRSFERTQKFFVQNPRAIPNRPD